MDFKFYSILHFFSVINLFSYHIAFVHFILFTRVHRFPAPLHCIALYFLVAIPPHCRRHSQRAATGVGVRKNKRQIREHHPAFVRHREGQGHPHPPTHFARHSRPDKHSKLLHSLSLSPFPSLVSAVGLFLLSSPSFPKLEGQEYNTQVPL